jgi:drug/metabolite transporter (DMT)-like permease
MNTQRIIGAALLALGVVLLVLGYQSSQGVDDQISEAVTGEYTDSTIWYWLLGAVSAAAGGAMLFLGKR